MGKKKNDIGSEILEAFIEGVFEEEGPINLSSHRESYSKGDYTRKRQEELYKEREQKRKDLENRRKKELAKQEEARKNMSMVPMVKVGEYSSTFCTVVGGAGLAITGTSMIFDIPKIIMGSGSVGGLAVGLMFFAIFGGIINTGIVRRNRLKLAKRVAQLVGQKGYMEISTLAGFLGMSEKKTIRSLRILINKGIFPQGHIDNENQNFMVTDDVYKQYLDTQKNARIEKRTEVIDTTAREINDTDVPLLTSEEQEKLNKLTAEGTDYIRQLRQLNTKIPGEVITAKLNRLDGLLSQIFESVKKHPEQMHKMQELMDYYLPTMIKLVTAYEEYDRIIEPGEDIISAKADIENTIDTINDAFKKLLNNLFKESVWDVTTDAQVLKTVLTQKGLSSDMEGDK